MKSKPGKGGRKQEGEAHGWQGRPSSRKGLGCFQCASTLVVLVDPACGTSNGLEVLAYCDRPVLAAAVVVPVPDRSRFGAKKMRAYGTQPRFHVPAQLCDPSDRPLCVHVLLSAGRRSSHQGGNEQQDPPWPKSAISFLHVDRYLCPSCCLFTSHSIRSPFTNLKTRSWPPPHPPRGRCSWGVFFRIFRYRPSRLVSSPCLPACLPHPSPAAPPAIRPRVQSTHGALPGPRSSSYRRISDTGHLQHAQTIHSHFCPVLLRPFTFFSPHKYPLCFHDLHWVPGLKTSDPAWQSLPLPTLGPLLFSCTEQPQLENALV